MLRLCAITDEIGSTFERALDLLEAYGLYDIEIHTLWGTYVEALTGAEIARLAGVLAERHMRIAALDSTVFLRCPLHSDQMPESWSKRFQSIVGDYAYHLAALDRCLEAARQLNVPLIRIFGFWGDGETTDEIVNEIAGRLAEPVRMAAQGGVTLALENCPHTYLPTTRQVLRVLQQVGSPHLRLLWDPSNAYRSGESDVADLTAEVKPYLAHMHVKGVVRSASAERGREYVALDKGDIDYHRLLKDMLAAGYAGYVSLEPHYALPKSGVEGAARESLDSLLRIVGTLEGAGAT
jgi:sugar phosphate isomerase/epimerase